MSCTHVSDRIKAESSLSLFVAAKVAFWSCESLVPHRSISVLSHVGVGFIPGIAHVHASGPVQSRTPACMPPGPGPTAVTWFNSVRVAGKMPYT